MGRWDFNQKPVLVFWETTIACGLKCKHCRAASIPKAPPEELDTDSGIKLIKQITDFGRPYPILILTGGDMLMRPDIFKLIDYGIKKGVSVAVSPSVTPLLTLDVLQGFKRSGIAIMSLSLDGAYLETHDAIRGIPGTWEKTIAMIKAASLAGLKVQINTTVMASNVGELPRIFQLIKENGASVWEVFFLIHSGRGTELADITSSQAEDVMHFLYHASQYGTTVRTVEAPFFRRVVTEYREGKNHCPDNLGIQLIDGLKNLMGDTTTTSIAQTMSTRDGKGIIFVSYKGDVYPSGFFPLVLGNVKNQPLMEIYQTNPILIKLREGTSLKGRCGACEYNDLCGGARARAFAQTGSPFEEDPACSYIPERLKNQHVSVISSKDL